jgi:hypothetical protein
MTARDVLGNRRIAIFMSDLFLRNRGRARLSRAYRLLETAEALRPHAKKNTDTNMRIVQPSSTHCRHLN